MKTRGSANSSELLPEDKTDFTSRIRPKRFDDFTGQNKTKENLKIFIESAKVLGESLDHILFTGPPGLGKTTLANIIANELETQIISTSGPVIEKPGDLAGMLTKLRQHESLYMDEIHRMPKVEEEM